MSGDRRDKRSSLRFRRVITITIILVTVSLFPSVAVGANNSEKTADFTVEFERIDTFGPGAIQYLPPLYNAMDFEFIPGTSYLLVSEWPQIPLDPPVISTWFYDGQEIWKKGSVILPPLGTMDYNRSYNQCPLPMAIRNSGSAIELFINRCHSMRGHDIERYHLDENMLVDASTKVTVLEVRTTNANISYYHKTGDMDFGSGGSLWVFTGYNDWAPQAQDNHSLSGSVLKFDVDSDGIPSSTIDNPNSTGSDWNEFVYAKGIRMPWRATEISENKWAFGDVGAHSIEEIDIVDSPGQNFGFGYWGVGGQSELYETGECPEGCEHLTNPILTYPHSTIHRFYEEEPDALISKPYQGYAVFVGEVIPENDLYPTPYANTLIFGDFPSGWLRSLDLNNTTNSVPLGSRGGVSDMEISPMGEVLILTTGQGTNPVHRDPGVWRLKISEPSEPLGATVGTFAFFGAIIFIAIVFRMILRDAREDRMRL